jgi:hypothetical protein|tara:strand:- start:1347 stop:3455 length:2109 start_codon:yes stop_codon:yes gene_type:complete
MAIENPHHYSTTSGVTTTTQISDDIDYPHSGLIKALSQGIRGNYAIKGSATDFDITLTSSTYTQIAVTTGKAYRDGKLVTITQLNATNLTGVHATEDVYQLLVAQANNTMALRGSNSVTNRIPDLTDGDIPIAVIKLVAGSAQGSNATTDRLVQFLTTSKVSNDLSIGYDNSGAYTETANISGASGVTTITAGSSTDVKVKLAGTAATDTFEVIDSASQVQFKVQGDGEVSTEGLLHSGGNIKVGGNVIQASDGGSTITMDTSDNVTIGGGLTTTTTATVGTDLTVNGATTINTDLKLSTSSDNAIIENVTQDKDIIFQVNDGGVTTEVMRIDGDVSRVGIGTTTPTANLHIKNTSETDNALRVETATSGNNAAPDISFFRNDSSIVDDQNLGVIKFDGIETHAGGSDAEVTYVSIAGTSLDASSTHATDSQAQGALKLYIKQVDNNDDSASPFPSVTFYGGTAKENNVSALAWAAAIGLFRGDALPQNTTSNKEVGHIWTKTDAHLHYTAFHPSSQTTQGEDYPVLLGGKHSIWIPAEAISPRNDAGCADLATTAAATAGRPDIRALAFDKDSDEHAQFTIAMPKMWNEGTITAQFYWTNIYETSGGVSWGLQGVSLSNNDAIDTAFGTPVVTDDTQVGTVRYVHISAESSAITIGGSPAANDLTCFQVYRDVSDSNDTLNEDALLLGIKLFYTIDGHNDE